MPTIIQQHRPLDGHTFTTFATTPISTSQLDNNPEGTTTDDHKKDNDALDEEEFMYDSQICWETMIGQEMVRLVTMDLYITIISIFVIDFLRGIWIRYCSTWWCWDIETTFPEYGEFKVAENVLHICNNQGMVWLGLFFAPLLPVINSVKLIVIMYIRGWACTTCNVPAREIFRASRSSSFFLYILLSALLLCIVPVGYVVTMKRPSTLCGPFAGQSHFYSIITNLIEGHLNKKVLRWIKYLTSPGVIFPIILLLILFIFFLFSMVRGLRKANTDLQKQLIHERTEEKRKIFELAGGGNRKKGAGLLPVSSTTAAAKAQQQQKSQRKLAVGQHLPEVERKRREPWRFFNNLNHKDAAAPSSLCPSDEPPSSLNSPGSDGLPNGAGTAYYTKIPPSFSFHKQQLQQLAPNKRADVVESGDNAFRPSLGSLEEAESVSTRRSSNFEQSAKDTGAQQQSLLPLNVPVDLSNSQTRSDGFVWERDGQEIARDKTPTSSTPEEISPSTETMNTIEMFPSSVTGLVGVGTPSVEAPHRIALYSREPKRIGIPCPDVPTSSQQQRQSSALPSRNDRIMHGHGGTINQKRDQSIPRNSSNRSANIVGPSTSSAKPSANLKTLPNKFADQFVPWPLPEEARKLRAQLLPITGTKIRPNIVSTSARGTRTLPSTAQQFTQISRAPSPSKMIKSIHSSELIPSQQQRAEPPRRFRITVSPIRKMEIVNQELQEVTPQRRLVIKQQVFTGSTSTFGGSSAYGMERVGQQPFLTAASRKLNSSKNQQGYNKHPETLFQQQAPCIEFGDDDSPRVEQQQQLTPRTPQR